MGSPANAGVLSHHAKQVLKSDIDRGTPYLTPEGMGQAIQFDPAGLIQVELKQKEEPQWFSRADLVRFPEGKVA